MPDRALPSTSAFPSDPSGMKREQLDALYLQLRDTYRSLMISRGLHRRQSIVQKEQIRDQSLEQWQQSEKLRELHLQIGDRDQRLSEALAREARLKAESYAMLEMVTDIMEHLEDAGDELSTAFGVFQLSKRRPGRGGSGGGGLAGAGMPQLLKGVLHFLNRWRLGKQRFSQLMAQREVLKSVLENGDGRDH